MRYSTQYYDPEFGAITLASDGESLVGLWLEGQKYFAGGAAESLVPRDDLPVFDSARTWLDRYFAGEAPTPDELPLAPSGSDFARRVWDILRSIPYGSLRTYGDIAAQIAAETGRRASAQAVGGAVGHNPISIIVPCHRVVGANGSLTGYAGGIDKKVRLLKHEGVDMTGLFVPKRGTAL
ncbi:methylated-DNA--[protein]-cysteine S-methyltransferase [Eggerthellaceae bacterium zg-893]|nr:methylated-DNA--[protein]-cysteine S-methyltransferase [Eggerthellaceae bacterium zg-893]